MNSVTLRDSYDNVSPKKIVKFKNLKRKYNKDEGFFYKIRMEKSAYWNHAISCSITDNILYIRYGSILYDGTLINRDSLIMIRLICKAILKKRNNILYYNKIVKNLKNNKEFDKPVIAIPYLKEDFEMIKKAENVLNSLFPN